MTDSTSLESLCVAELSKVWLQGRRESDGVIRFPAASSEVGDLIVYFDNGEITVDIEKITHIHFTPYEADTTNAAHTVHDCAREAAQYVAGVLSGQWILWRYPNGAGGSYEVGTSGEELADSPVGPDDTEKFLWSGPYSGPA
jgi:hypothetical protein